MTEVKNPLDTCGGEGTRCDDAPCFSPLSLREKEAWDIVGGLAEPGKMPGYAWGVSRKHCKRGSILRNLPRTICRSCYTGRGFYGFPQVQAALERRYHRMNMHTWIDAMIALAQHEDAFRWHDTGDLQSVRQLDRILTVCEQTPWCRHWLATREAEIVRAVLATRRIPDNLNIRISADYVDGDVTQPPIPECTLATVTSYQVAPDALNCPVTFGDGSVKSCDDARCTACWDRSVERVNYRLH